MIFLSQKKSTNVKNIRVYAIYIVDAIIFRLNEFSAFWQSRRGAGVVDQVSLEN